MKMEKCQIAVPQVEFLGYLIDVSSLHPMETNVQAIKQVLTPTDKIELQTFLGLLNFYNVHAPQGFCC